jgi:hypothetical protein
MRKNKKTNHVVGLVSFLKMLKQDSPTERRQVPLMKREVGCPAFASILRRNGYGGRKAMADKWMLEEKQKNKPRSGFGFFSQNVDIGLAKQK